MNNVSVADITSEQPSMIEVELRYTIENVDKLRQFLDTKIPLSKKYQIDVYYDTDQADLYKQGLFIRTRNNKTLDFKFNKEDFFGKKRFGAHTHCSEYTYDLPLKEGNLGTLNTLLKGSAPLESDH